jgi:hypothetical protein
MIRLLALAEIPGYKSDVMESNGAGLVVSKLFDQFSTIFEPHNPSTSGSDLVSRLSLFIIALTGIFFFLRILSAGFGYLTSSGDPAKIQSASKEIMNGAIGLVIVICAYFVTFLIQQFIGIDIFK